MVNHFKKSVFTAFAATVGLVSVAQDAAPNGWHLKDRATQGFYGISLDKAYDFVKGKKSKTVIVAVIDSGIDTLHEDLKPVLWRNPKEIAGNGIDDDGNGYVDDIHGWNFIGGRDGRNVKQDSYEVSRVYHKYKTRFANITDPSALSKEEQALYKEWKRAEKEIAPDPNEMMNLMLIKGAYKEALKGDSVIKKLLNKEDYTGADVEAFNPTTDEGKKAKERVLRLFMGLGIESDKSAKVIYNEIGDYIEGQERKAESSLKAPKNYRGDIVKDNYEDINDRFYGNNDVMANTPFHGTHVSGIIAAARKNGKGIDGIASDVRIMTIRAVPDGDEHDKDIALAIRYAVDNGAKVINMSFGKGFSPEKHWVDEAVKYAESKGVLLVHAAGNSSANLDSSHNYPTANLKAEGKRASNWIEVGASGDPKNGGLVANFSNYGKKEVDVFAPGHQIYSTVPGGNTYGNASGTSMASPVVAGVAAFLFSYYPELTPQQVKYAIEKGSVILNEKFTAPDGDTATLADISRTGGLVNALGAAKVAETLVSKKPQPQTKPKPQVKKAKKA